MSYILDALKKAETDRHATQKPDIDQILSQDWPDEPSKKHSPLLYMTLTILLGVALLLFLHWIGAISLFVSDEQKTKANTVSLATEQPHNSPQDASSTNTQKLALPSAPAASDTIKTIDTKTPQPNQASIANRPEKTSNLQLAQATATSSPKFNYVINGHMFLKKNSSMNRVFIGEAALAENDQLDNTWLVTEIAADYIRFRHQHTGYVETVRF